MDDSIGGKTWSLDQRARAALLLERARCQLADGDPEGAVVYAEELLDEDPDDADALLVVADAAPRYGHGEVGLLAAQKARRLGRDPGVIEAAAMLSACLVDDALAATAAILEANTANARAWAVRAQALEVLGRLAEADDALERAHALRPESYPRAVQLHEAQWDAAVREALSMLDTPERRVAARWRVELRDAPTIDDLQSVRPVAPPATFALLLTTDGGPVLRAFRRPLCRGANDAEEVSMRLAEAIRYEVELRAE